MTDPILSRRRALGFLSVLLLTPAAFADAPAPEPPAPLKQTAGDLSATLRLLASTAAAVEAVLYLRVEQTGSDGKTAAVPFATIEAFAAPVTTPEGTKPSKQTLRVYPGGVDGEWSLVGTFPAPGLYAVTVTVAANGDGSKPVTLVFAPITVADKDTHSAPPAESPFALKMDASPSQPLPGEAVELRFSVTDTRTKKRVVQFEPVYESPMRVYVVREDVSSLFIVKPQAVRAAPGSRDDGIFTANYAFATGGSWRLFVEVAPQNEGVQLLTSRITIAGARALPEPMMAQMAPIVRQGGVSLRLEKPQRLVARETQTISFIVEDEQGKPISDLQLIDGSLAHLYFVERDAKTFVHAVPDRSDPRNGRSGSETLSFPVRFPKGGIYRGFINVQRGANPVLLSFVLRVNDR